jgi:hypothetical protein
MVLCDNIGKIRSNLKKNTVQYLLASLFLVFFLLSMVVAIKSQEVGDTQAVVSHSSENPLTVAVINKYLILALLLDVGIVILLWKTVNDFLNLPKFASYRAKLDSDHG